MLMPTQKTNIYHVSTPGILFNGAQTWTIAEGVIVGSKNDVGVFSSFSGSKLINKGQVFSATIHGVSFKANGSTIVNKASGSIFGFGGVYTDGNNTTLTNQGSILGYDQHGVWAYNTSHFDLHNDGEIYGHTSGVFANSTLAGLPGITIDNAGLIRADLYGIAINTDGNETTTIVNEHGGTIKGSNAAIYALTGRLSLENHGTIKGNVVAAFASVASDAVVNDGTIKGSVYLGSGNDVYKNTGGKAGKIDSELGNDKLTAGPHTDKFVFDTALNAATNVDTVKHFDPGTDKLFLDQAIFTMLTGPGTLKGHEFHIGKHAGDADDHIIYNKHTGALYYDSNGSLPGARVQFAKLDAGLHLHHDDFTVFA
jgi:hypothetical protein